MGGCSQSDHPETRELVTGNKNKGAGMAGDSVDWCSIRPKSEVKRRHGHESVGHATQRRELSRASGERKLFSYKELSALERCAILVATSHRHSSVFSRNSKVTVLSVLPDRPILSKFSPEKTHAESTTCAGSLITKAQRFPGFSFPNRRIWLTALHATHPVICRRSHFGRFRNGTATSSPPLWVFIVKSIPPCSLGSPAR